MQILNGPIIGHCYSVTNQYLYFHQYMNSAIGVDKTCNLDLQRTEVLLSELQACEPFSGH